MKWGRMKRKFFFVFIWLLLIIVFSIVIHTGHALPQQSNSYPRLPYKELIFPATELLSAHAPSIVELPDGELFAVWYGATPWSPHSVIRGARRPAGSDKWTKPSIIQYSPILSNKNPVLYLNKDKKLLLFWVEEKRWLKWPVDMLWMKVSEDFGRTWGPARKVGTPLGFLSRNHPITLRDGQVLLPIYSDWNTSSAAVISKDGGLTWGAPKYMLFLFGTQPTVVQRADLSLFALTRSGMPPRLSWQAISRDMARSWNEHKLSDIKNPGSSLEMIKLRNGHVVLVFNNSKKDRSDLSLALSYDDGRTWPHIREIEYKSDRVNAYPSLMQDNRGLIHVVYSYDGRKGIAHFVTDERWIEGQPKF